MLTRRIRKNHHESSSSNQKEHFKELKSRGATAQNSHIHFSQYASVASSSSNVSDKKTDDDLPSAKQDDDLQQVEEEKVEVEEKQEELDDSQPVELRIARKRRSQNTSNTQGSSTRVTM